MGKTNRKKGKSFSNRKTSLNSDATPKLLPQVEINQLVALFSAGRYAELENRACLLVEQYPDSGFAWMVLGASLKMQNKDALRALQRAAELSPNDVEAHNNLGVSLQESGQSDGAVASYRRALEIKPDYVEAHYNLGIALQGLGQLDGAVASYRRALEIQPDYAQAYNNLGIALQGLGQFDGAVASYRRALEIKPDYAEAHNNLGNALRELRQPNDAVASYRRAVEIKPDYAEAHYNLGIALQSLGQLDSAVESYRRALKTKPDYAQAYNNLGIALQCLGQFDDAVASYRRAVEIKPDYAEAHNNLGNALQDLGQLDYAQTSYCRALEIKPGYSEAHSNKLLAMQYAAGYTQAELFAAHLAYAQHFEAPLKEKWLPHSNTREPGKRLKIGYVSPDFRKHSVAYFIETVFAHHNREQVEVYCYSNNPISDEVTLRLKSLVEHWCDIKMRDDEAVATQIRHDGIDILIDLAGHTAGSRLLTFARKPAPVQASWLGYPCTTGLSAVDYRISDIYADPVGMSERYYSETLYRLPATTTCYHPPHPSPEVGSLPALAQGSITFGSFNNLPKVTPEVRALWARILLATPGSRLMLKTNSLADMSARQHLIAEFAGHGIAEERLILASHDATHYGHLDRYNKVDIGLDPFPYNGVTTTFEAMWMGVPVVAMTGNSYVSRMGVNILSNLGLTELLAGTPEEYVAIATRLAGDPEHLAELRGGLRERMTSSPLTDGKRFTLDLEKAYREMWQTFVAEFNAGIQR